MSILPKIGFIGLGIMGQPMVRNLLKAGYPVTAYNRSQPAMEALHTHGATLAESPAALTAQVDVVMTCVSDSPDVEAIVFSPTGVLSSIRAGMIFIDLSTINSAMSRTVYEA